MRARALITVPAVLAVAGSLLLAAGPVALGKENVKARLLTPLRLDAAPGEQLTVAWALAGSDEHGRHQPFNAIGVFVQLLSASGDRPTIGFATPDAHPQGRYDAQVGVPKGGIGGVRIGLRGDGDGDAGQPLPELAGAGRGVGAAGRARGHDRARARWVTMACPAHGRRQGR
jgi:hypothetical protein